MAKEGEWGGKIKCVSPRVMALAFPWPIPNPIKGFHEQASPRVEVLSKEDLIPGPRSFTS